MPPDERSEPSSTTFRPGAVPTADDILLVIKAAGAVVVVTAALSRLELSRAAVAVGAAWRERTAGGVARRPGAPLPPRR